MSTIKDMVMLEALCTQTPISKACFDAWKRSMICPSMDVANMLHQTQDKLHRTATGVCQSENSLRPTSNTKGRRHSA